MDQASGVFKQVGDNAEKTQGPLGKVAGGLGKVATIAGGFVLAQGLLKLPGLMSGAVGAASDLEESLNKANVVFGNSSKQILDFANTSAKSFGIAKSDALGYSAVLGTILKGSGLSEQASADMSEGLVKLAADMASFNNIPIDQALDKIRAGLVGESEPLRTVGVLLSEAAVQEEAYAMGIAKSGEKLTDQQKVQARYSLILKQTADTQGDFERTSDSLANRQRILGAQFDDMKAKIGAGLLPVMLALGGFVLNVMFPAFEKVLSVVTPLTKLFGAALTGDVGKANAELAKLPKPLQEIGEAVRDAGAFIRKDAIPAIKSLLPTLKDIGRFILADVRPHVMEFARITKDLIAGTIKNFVAPALITLKQGWDDIWPTLKADVIPVLRDVGRFLLEHKPLIIGIATAILLITNPWLAVVAVLIIVLAKWDEIKEMLTVTIPDAINSVIESIKGIPIIGEIFEGALKAVAVIVETYFKIIMIQVETAIKAIRAIIEIVLGIIHGDFGRVWQGIKDLVGALLGGLVAQAGVWLDALKNIVFIALQALVGIWRDQFVLARDTVLGILGGLPGQIAGVAVSVANAAYDLGASIPKKIGQAMHELAGFVKTPLNILIGTFENAINFIIRAINKFNPAGGIGGIFNKVSGLFGGPQLPSFNIPEVSLPRLHQGTPFFAGGPANILGEETVILPRGSRVLTPAQAAGGGGNVNIHLHSYTLTGNIPPAQQMQLEEWLRGVMRRISR